MPHRHPLPHLWLMTDERMGDGLWAALGRLPHGAGVIFRHYATPPAARRRIFDRVRRITRKRRVVLILAGSPREAIGWRADGAHGRSPHRIASRALLRTAPAHDRREHITAGRAGADLVLLSPIFATRSHPGAAALGAIRFGVMTRGAKPRAIALGGMDARKFRRLRPLGAYGWAAIDAWLAAGIRT